MEHAQSSRRWYLSRTLGLAILASPGGVAAFEFNTGIADLGIHWDNTVKYSAGWRLKSQSPTLIDSPPTTVNQDDGDRNFDRGLISSRVDLLSELDVVYRNFGARVSFAAWYDWVYNRINANNSPATANQFSVPFNEFTNATRELMGADGEFLDYFVFGKGALGDMQGSFRLGNHTLLWGETLFFGGNGIAGGQAPVDIIKLLAVPNTQFKELIRPVGQISAQLQITPEIAIGGYYQYRWAKTRIPAVGSYLSSGDIIDWGGERFLLGPPPIPGVGPPAWFRVPDESAKSSGQGGVQLRLRAHGVDYGLYAIRYHEKTPQLYVRPSVDLASGAVLDPANFNPVTGQVGTYYQVFPENVTAYGASASATIGDVNLAGEISIRRNTPLVSNLQFVFPGMAADNDANPLYAVGNSVHANFSWLWSLPPNFISNEATLLGEIGWNRRTSITKNPDALDPNTTTNAWGFRIVYEPVYRQVMAGLDLSLPMGIGYNPSGKSSVVPNFNGGVDRGGDLSVGIAGAYLNDWRFALSYTHYLGDVGTFIGPDNHRSFKQSLRDRDWISFNIRTTF